MHSERGVSSEERKAADGRMLVLGVSTHLGGCYALLEPVKHGGDGDLGLLVSRKTP